MSGGDTGDGGSDNARHRGHTSLAPDPPRTVPPFRQQSLGTGVRRHHDLTDLPLRAAARRCDVTEQNNIWMFVVVIIAKYLDTGLLPC